VGVSRILFHGAKSHNPRMLGILVRVLTRYSRSGVVGLRKTKEGRSYLQKEKP
jgi:hypothetical protein